MTNNIACLQTVDFSMIVSEYSEPSTHHQALKEAHLTGLEFEAVSVLTQPSVDLQGDFVEETPRPNLGDPNIKYPPILSNPYLKDGLDDVTNVAIEPLVRTLRKKKIAESRDKSVHKDKKDVKRMKDDHHDGHDSRRKSSQGEVSIEHHLHNNEEERISSSNSLVSEVGKEEEEEDQDMLEQRYLRRPSDLVVIAMSLISHHDEVRRTEVAIASLWLEIWNDCSDSYRLLRIKGRNMVDV